MNEVTTREQSGLRLMSEVYELRQLLGQAVFLSGSKSMESVLRQAQKAAQSNENVWLCGERGTGKSTLARVIHSASKASSSPFVMIDCAFVDEIEFAKRVEQSNGGTLYLHCLEGLSSALRVRVQALLSDQYFSAKFIDARLIASSADVTAQKPLSFTLIELPPLQERGSECLLLARHFLERYNLQYAKSIHGFTREAEKALQEYVWPGNVRELQQQLLRAVVSHVGNSYLDVSDFSFKTQNIETSKRVTPILVSKEALRGKFKILLERLLLHVDFESKHCSPFGKWLEEDLLLAAFRLSSGIHRKAARLLGIAETTARRRIGYLVEREALAPQSRHPDWTEIPSFLEQWIVSEKNESKDLIVLARNLLLESVTRRVGEKNVLASSLMGVTEPTYLRWRQKLEQQSASVEV